MTSEFHLAAHAVPMTAMDRTLNTSYLVLAEHLPCAGAQVWDSNFLPPYPPRCADRPGDDPIPPRHLGATEYGSRPGKCC